ncbi:MAG TPA: two-component regulator propeller domain-containing protein [Flavisolibacter sp.]|jgi:ligand-binding sensor domain-containing protein/two-component sensor histidine kinase|nr:two-component regulator propeller domain-containing protein [Flavisolibacter sp.]
MRVLFVILLLISTYCSSGQQDFVFTRFTIDDNLGLTSNVVSSLHQDAKGYVWVGTANGLQRFDGTKFVHVKPLTKGSDILPHSVVSQIIPTEGGKLFLNLGAFREFGIFDPSTYVYKKIPVHTAKPLNARSDQLLWKDSKGDIFLLVFRYGVLRYDKTKASFVDDKPFPFPAGYVPSLIGVHDDPVKQQVWFACEKGLCVYDRKSGQMWYKDFNPENLPLLVNEKLNANPTQFYIDKSRRFWVFAWPKNIVGQVRYCLDSTGTMFLQKDTVGLNSGPTGYSEYNFLFETSRSTLWIYGVNNLFNWDAAAKRFHYNRSRKDGEKNSIEYSQVYQLLEDKDGNIWIATDKGLYFTSISASNLAVINFLLKEDGAKNNISDMVEMPNSEMWITSWGNGVLALDNNFQQRKLAFHLKPPAHWPHLAKDAVKLTWTICRQTATGKVWIGCNYGVLLVHNPATNKTDYLFPPEAGQSTIRYITEDEKGNLWLATQSGRLLKWDGKQFTLMLDIGTIIYKIFFDKEGLIWLATQEKGLYCLDTDGKRIIRHYTADGSKTGLYANTGRDIEQLNDSTIVYAAGALNFINKKRGTVQLLRFEDGLPSNNVLRLRTDTSGHLWFITPNGLSRYNPRNNRITTYSSRDGINVADQTVSADYRTKNNYLLFGGDNALLLFQPANLASNQTPPDVVITDFKLFNQFLPVDSLLQQDQIKLAADQNSFSIYFSSLSYQQNNRLTYYFKLDGVDKDWIVSDGNNFRNYSLLPPGDYAFQVYAENIDGVRSPAITRLHIVITPPFWQTSWFVGVLVGLIIAAIYYLHNLRIQRLLAMEKLRSRVARDLHDDMGSTLSTINILSSMAKSKMHTDAVKTATYLSKISDNSQRMMEAMDDIVWSIKPANDSMQRVVARMREFATNILEAKDISLHFKVDESVYQLKLNMEARRDFFLLFKEALNNAAKYSKGSDVWIEINTKNKVLSLLVKDNGTGFNVAATDEGNGLGNMQKRATSLKGKLHIHSQEGRGTAVRLLLPTE